MQRFMTEWGWQRAMRSIVKRFGIVENSARTSFKAVAHPSESNGLLIYPGLAYNSSMEAIVLNENRTLALGSGSDRKWVILSRAETHEEQGTVSIQTDGSLTGVGTKFTEVLRGQPNFPTKIRFTNSGSSNVQEYEVVSVISDTSAILTGNFTAQSGLKYAVIGAFTPGFVPSEEIKNIYSYDSCSLRVVTSDVQPELNEGEYLIARIDYGVNGITVDDLRSDYMFSVIEGDEDEVDYRDGINPCVSLLTLNRVGGSRWKDEFGVFELIVEFGYFVNGYEVSTGATNYFTITSGTCNAMASVNPSDIPVGTFNGFLLLNRSNMKWVRIISQDGARLTLDNVDMSKLLGDTADFIIIPNFTHIELSAQADGAVTMPSVPFTFEGEVSEGRCRIILRLKYPYESEGAVDSVNIALKYRMYSAGRSGLIKSFNSAPYIDGLQNLTITSAGSITVNLADIQPVEHLDNYS